MQINDHYVPRYYLEGFTRPNTKEIWTYIKGEKRKFISQPKSVGGENNFYSREVDRLLTHQVEAPAHKILKKIRDRVEISQEEKNVFSIYILVMSKRVPNGLRRFKEMAPQVLENLRADLSAEYEKFIADNPDRIQAAKKRRLEAEEMLAVFGANPHKDIWQELIDPDKTPRSIQTLSNMEWCFLIHDREPAFLTCDDPVFFFSELGIGQPRSELTFPISSNIALFATWKPRGLYQQANKANIEEVNRRTVSNATKYIFHALDEEWVMRLTNRNRYELRQMR